MKRLIYCLAILNIMILPVQSLAADESNNAAVIVLDAPDPHELDTADQSPPVLVRVFSGTIRGAVIATFASLSYYASINDISTINLEELLTLLKSAEFWRDYGPASIVGATLSGSLSAFNNELQKFYDDKNKLVAIGKSFSVEYVYVLATAAWIQYISQNANTTDQLLLTSFTVSLKGFWAQTFGELALASGTRKLKKKVRKIKPRLIQALSDSIVLVMSASTVAAQVLLLTNDDPNSETYALGTKGIIALTVAGLSAYAVNLLHDKRMKTLENEVPPNTTPEKRSYTERFVGRCQQLFDRVL